MFCKYCGAPLADGAVFCAHCGNLRQNTYVPPRTRAQSSPYMPAAAYALPRTLPPAVPAKEQTNVFGVIGLLCSLFAALPLCFAAGLLPCCLCLAALGADVRDMEGAAIAHAACAADVPVWAFKAISDNAGEKSIREYSENLQIALAALGEKLPDIFAEVNNG